MKIQGDINSSHGWSIFLQDFQINDRLDYFAKIAGNNDICLSFEGMTLKLFLNGCIRAAF